jgi:hypothetical protein
MKNSIQKSSSVWRAFGFAVGGILLFCATAFAQVDTGTILGTIRDTSGAVIPGVSVTLVNEDTKVTLQALTDDRGNYLFAALRVGSYTLTAELQGFKKVIHEHLRLNIQQRLVLDLTLELGGLEQVVDGTGAAPVLQTQMPL